LAIVVVLLLLAGRTEAASGSERKRVKIVLDAYP